MVKKKSLASKKKVIKKRNLKIIPPISKKSPKYGDHPPNAGHGFAALIFIYTWTTVFWIEVVTFIAAQLMRTTDLVLGYAVYILSCMDYGRWGIHNTHITSKTKSNKDMYVYISYMYTFYTYCIYYTVYNILIYPRSCLAHVSHLSITMIHYFWALTPIGHWP